MDRKIPRRRGKSLGPPPEFALLRSSPAQPDSRTQRRTRRRVQPETASSWDRNFLSARRTDWQPAQVHFEPSIDQSEAALLTPLPNQAPRMFQSNEIHPDNDAARSLRQFCTPPRRPRDRTASTPCRKYFDPRKAQGRPEGQAKKKEPATHTHD